MTQSVPLYSIPHTFYKRKIAASAKKTQSLRQLCALFVGALYLYRHFGLDMGPGVVANEFEVFVVEVEDVLDVGVDLHDGQGTRVAGELQTGLLEVVQIEVGVARSMDKVAWFEACDLCHHL